MKKLILLLALFLMMPNIHGQEASKADETKNYYLEKSKNQKTTAWILLGSGTAMAIGGAIGFSENFWESSADTYGYIMIAGIVADLVSIPFFISASKNKKKAASLAFNIQNVPYHIDFTKLDQATSVSVRINF